MTNPWIKFYPRDWRGDQALRAVSVAARGFWMECICIMHEARPYGHLVLNGRPVEGDILARMTGTSVDEVSALLAELRQAGVLSMTSDGVVFSRRMTKDFARAQKGRKSVQKRWSQDADNKEKSASPNRSPNRVPTEPPITQKPELSEERIPPSPIGDVPPKVEEPVPRQSRPDKGTRLPSNWQPSDDDCSAAQAEGLTDDQIHRESAKFRDYWLAKPGAGGVKLDWPATWRNWVRRAADDGRTGPSGSNRGSGATSRPTGGGREPVGLMAILGETARELDGKPRF